ncbi:YkvA family protein [Paenibacillus harenae]|uniref:YkvA family protein n=1 Tax=Paenibacillus harenae TaxID=306543 RepID=UPI0004029BA2|nr:DUF1232 domain-containing protein [Paenibacillus harenae]
MVNVECPTCGNVAEVGEDTQLDAGCPSCGNELARVDVNKWLVKIGDHEKQTKYVEEGFWAKAKRHAAKVPFAKEVVTLYYCSLDPNTPLSAKITAVGALAYWIMPLDLIPDFVPVAGFADDATAVLIAYKALSGQITDEHREKAEQFFALNKNVKLIIQKDEE